MEMKMVRRIDVPETHDTWASAALAIVPQIPYSASEVELTERCERAAEQIAKRRDPLFSHYKTDDSRRAAGTKVRAWYEANRIVGISTVISLVSEHLPPGESPVKREKPVTAVSHEVRRLGRIPPRDIVRCLVLKSIASK
jgi:hypothetical protein